MGLQLGNRWIADVPLLDQGRMRQTNKEMIFPEAYGLLLLLQRLIALEVHEISKPVTFHLIVNRKDSVFWLTCPILIQSIEYNTTRYLHNTLDDRVTI